MGELSPALSRTRGGADELSNVMRVLEGPRRAGDYSESVRETPSRAKDVSLIWHAIEGYKGGDAPATELAKENMRHGLLMALATSIEDDGHRVCGVGQRHRLVAVLQGFYSEVRVDAEAVTVGQLLTALAKEFADTHGEDDPTPDAVAKFRADALARAAERFGDDSPEVDRFTQHLRDYLALQYDVDAK